MASIHLQDMKNYYKIKYIKDRLKPDIYKDSNWWLRSRSRKIHSISCSTVFPEVGEYSSWSNKIQTTYSEYKLWQAFICKI